MGRRDQARRNAQHAISHPIVGKPEFTADLEWTRSALSSSHEIESVKVLEPVCFPLSTSASKSEISHPWCASVLPSRPVSVFDGDESPNRARAASFRSMVHVDGEHLDFLEPQEREQPKDSLNGRLELNDVVMAPQAGRCQ